MSKVCIVFYVFDDLNRFLDSFILNTEIVSAIMGSNFSELNQLNCHKKFAAVLKVDGYFLSVFSRMIQISDFYSKMVAANLCKSLRVDRVNSDVKIKFQLIKPKLEILDYAWNKRLTDLVSQKQELEHAMSWLSTLGGAFSALGDTFENYAKVAGKISILQFKIASQLGEPSLVARCMLYMALSLIQLGQLSVAKKLILKQFEIGKNLKDIRLQNMCKGVWAKLKFVYKPKITI